MLLNLESMDVGITPLLYRAAHRCTVIHNEMFKEFSISVQQVAVLSVIEFVGNGENMLSVTAEKGITKYGNERMDNRGGFEGGRRNFSMDK